MLALKEELNINKAAMLIMMITLIPNATDHDDAANQQPQQQQQYRQAIGMKNCIFSLEETAKMPTRKDA